MCIYLAAALLMSGDHTKANDLSPGGASFHQQLASSGSGRAVAADAEMVANRAERSQKVLGVLRRLEPAHQPFALTCRLM